MRMMDPGRIDASFAPRRRGDLTSVELDGETVLYEPDGGTMHKLDAVGSVLWNAFDGRTTLGELAVDVREVFDADADTASRDVLGYARTLGRSGLLEGVRPDDGPAAP